MWQNPDELNLTVLTAGGGTTRSPLFVDARSLTVRQGRRSLVVSRRCFELLKALNDARLSGAHAASWEVSLDEIGALSAWHVKRARSTASLGAEVRREIKCLQRAGLDLVACSPRCLTTGPYWLKVEPFCSHTSTGIETRQRTGTVTPQRFARWLAISEAVWRSVYLWDKEGENLTRTLNAAAISDEFGPVPRVVACIDLAKRMRDAGGYDTAADASSTALRLVRKIDNPHLRTYFEATCHLQNGWTAYRRDKVPEAERFVQRGFEVLDGSGQGHLRVRGQLLTVRSLIRRRQNRYELALQDLWSSAECAFVDSDWLTLMSTYQNLSYLAEELADKSTAPQEREDLIEFALQCSDRNSQLRRQLGLGFNTVVTDIHRAHLLGRMGRYDQAIDVAEQAFESARKTRNWPNVEDAHFEMVSLRLASGDVPAAEELHSKFLDSHCSTKAERRRATLRYEELRRGMAP